MAENEAPPRGRPSPNFIRQWRKHRGMTLDQLADRSGISATNISNLERGLTGYSWVSLEALAEALNCKPGQLLSEVPGGEQEPDLGDPRLHPADRRLVLDIIRLLIDRR